MDVRAFFLNRLQWFLKIFIDFFTLVRAFVADCLYIAKWRRENKRKGKERIEP